MSLKTNSTMPANEAFLNEELLTPELEESEEIGLYIECAGHPTNFIFRLTKYERDLDQLEASMSDFYNNEGLEELDRHEIAKSRLYAVCDEDYVWHRVVATDSIVGSSRVPVRFCDYGGVILAPITSLRKLMPEFRKIPFMAVKGQLAGVTPLVENWSLDDCERFHDLVEDQLLVGTIVGVVNGENVMDKTVFLNLSCTSDNGDVDIAEVLVRENRAIRDG